jgi:hypothetical protein
VVLEQHSAAAQCCSSVCVHYGGDYRTALALLQLTSISHYCVLLLLNKQVRSGCFTGEAVAKWMAAVGEASCIEESCAMCDRYLSLVLLPLLLVLVLLVLPPSL